MSTLEETVAALQRRVEALETENAGLRGQLPDQLLVDQTTSRRHPVVWRRGAAWRAGRRLAADAHLGGRRRGRSRPAHTSRTGL